MSFDITSYLMGKASGGGGGGGITILSGSDDPSPSAGVNGQIYLKLGQVKTVEYIESGGGPWLSTGYVPISSSEFIMDMELQSPNNNYDTPFGSRTGTADVFVAYNGGTYRFVWGSASQNVGSVTAYYGQRVQMSLRQGRVALEQNGTVLLESTFSATLGATSAPMGIFTLATGADENVSICNARGKLYSFTVLEEGVEVRKYIPVLGPGGDPGLYETHTGLYCYNKGSGNLVAGPSSGVLSMAVEKAFAKVSGGWQNLVGTDINDINLGG